MLPGFQGRGVGHASHTRPCTETVIHCPGRLVGCLLLAGFGAAIAPTLVSAAPANTTTALVTMAEDSSVVRVHSNAEDHSHGVESRSMTPALPPLLPPDFCDPPAWWCTHDGATKKFAYCSGVPGNTCTDSMGNTGFHACTGTTPPGTAWPRGTRAVL